jgi:hypothetical protein
MSDTPPPSRLDKAAPTVLISISLAIAATIPGSVAAITDPVIRSLITIVAVLVILAMGERAGKRK